MTGTQRRPSSGGASGGAIEAIGDFMDALNAGDAGGVYDLLHLPHIRISGGGVAIWHNRAELEATYLRDFYDRAGADWHHTILDSAEVWHEARDKAHILIQFTRCRADGGAIATYRSLWIMTRVNGRWGAQARSSFAP